MLAPQREFGGHITAGRAGRVQEHQDHRMPGREQPGQTAAPAVDSGQVELRCRGANVEPFGCPVLDAGLGQITTQNPDQRGLPHLHRTQCHQGH
jgi:hypothetical protein